MSAGYVIAQLKITNPENYKEYIEKVNPIIKKIWWRIFSKSW